MNTIRNLFSTNKKITGNTTSYLSSALLLDEPDYDHVDERRSRYYLYERFYANQIFTYLNTLLSPIKARHSLYKHIRSPYNPVERLVEGYVSYIYGGAVDFTHLRTGAIPIQTDNTSEREAISTVLRHSDFDLHKNLYARYAAKLGDTFIKVVDDTSEGVVYLDVINPHYVEDIRLDRNRNITFIRFSYQVTDDNGNTYTYTEEIDEAEFRTYRDDEAYAYTEINGTPMASWPNPYGFVPVTYAKFRDNGNTYGVNAFYAQMYKIFEVNDVSSLLLDNIRNSVQAIYHAKNVAKGSLSSNRDEATRDMIRILYTQGAGELEPLIAQINIEGAMQKINSLLREIELDLPVLSLHKVREMSQISAVAVKAMYTDAISRITEAMTNLDNPLSKAIQMAIAINGYRGYLPGYNLNYYTDRRASFSILPRDVIADKLSASERMQTLLQLNAESPLTPLILEELGLGQDAKELAEQRAQERRQERIEEALLTTRTEAIQSLSTTGANLRLQLNQGDTGVVPNE